MKVVQRPSKGPETYVHEFPQLDIISLFLYWELLFVVVSMYPIKIAINPLESQSGALK